MIVLTSLKLNCFRKVKWLILLILFSATSLINAQKKTEFTVLNYNALHGFQNDTLLKQQYINWVKDMQPDVVAYQEMNGFSQNAIGELADSYGHPYAVIMNQEFGVPVTHPLAITSKYPILNVERVLDNMWHGYLYAHINGIHMIVTHLAPFTLKDRQEDIRKIMAQIDLFPKKDKILLMGDFNALSPEDSDMYGEELLNAMKNTEGQYIAKSKSPILRNRTIYRRNLNNGEVDYSVIQTILASGFKDSFYLKNIKFKNSVPTKGYTRSNSKLRRIDYIFVEEELAGNVISADILQDEMTSELSDHYPVLVKFDLSKK